MLKKVLCFLCFLALLHVSAAEDELVRCLESVPTAKLHAYKLRNDKGRSMDCLKIFQTSSERSGKVYGLYHVLEGGVFRVYLAQSQDLVKWVQVAQLDEHASQPTIWQCGNGSWLMAYEKDAPNSCWIRLRLYRTLADLSEARYEKEFDIARSLAPTAEGTPSFESVRVKDNNLADSEIRLRFHYFKDTRQDQLAWGTLTDFKLWKAEPSDEINTELRKRGWLGNLGDRESFLWADKIYYLQEIQRIPGEWDSWRVCLCNSQGMPLKVLNIHTHAGSTAFANPNATWIVNASGKKLLAITLFLPGEGNVSSESGTLLYVIDPELIK